MENVVSLQPFLREILFGTGYVKPASDTDTKLN